MEKKRRVIYKEYLTDALCGIATLIGKPLVVIIGIIFIGYNCDSVKKATTYMAGVVIAYTLMNAIDCFCSMMMKRTFPDAQKAFKQRNQQKQVEGLLQNIVVAIMISGIILLLKEPIWILFKGIFRLEKSILEQVAQYYHIAIWSVPFIALNYVGIGWFAGNNEKKSGLWMCMGDYIAIVFVYIFVNQYKMGVSGMALAILLGQMIVTVGGIFLVLRMKLNIRKHVLSHSITWWPQNLYKDFMLYTDYWVKGLCTIAISIMVLVTTYIQGIDLLIASAFMLQVKEVMASCFEGISYAVSQIAIRSKEENDMELSREIHRITLDTAMFLSIGWVIGYTLLGHKVKGSQEILNGIKNVFYYYDGWLIIYPIVAGTGLTMQGLYNGSKKKKNIKNIYLISIVICFVVYANTKAHLGIHGMWLAITVFYFIRTVGLLAYQGSLYKTE
ncbi:MAG: hypothetical protein E7231_08140 [Cellulosilyticum sp.]|nr:hypothetical protein [Cellulosilyticum sp.]